MYTRSVGNGNMLLAMALGSPVGFVGAIHGYEGHTTFKPPGNQRQRRKAMRQRRSGWGRKQMQRGRCR
jgi:hypothetical protein